MTSSPSQTTPRFPITEVDQGRPKGYEEEEAGDRNREKEPWAESRDSSSGVCCTIIGVSGRSVLPCIY